MKSERYHLFFSLLVIKLLLVALVIVFQSNYQVAPSVLADVTDSSSALNEPAFQYDTDHTDVLEEEVTLEEFIDGDGSVSMLAFGDMLLDRYVRTLIERDGAESILEGLNEDPAFFEDYDFVFANLEGPVTPNRVPTGKSIAFQFSPEHLDILTENQFNMVSVANNHTFDMGWAGYEDTYRYLAERDIVALGDPRGVSEKSSYETEINGQKIGFAAFNHSDFKIVLQEALDVVAELRERNDFVVVSIHWGVEYQNVPQPWQREWAKKMVASGADLILGHHPHVLQGLEFIEGKPVFYSLGNFVFDQWFSIPTQETIALGLEFETRDDSRYLNLDFTPIRLDYARPYLPDEEEGQAIIDKFYGYSQRTNADIETYKALFETGSFELKL